MSATITYHGWSSLAIDSPEGKLVFDPFWRPYCGASWFGPEAFDGASVICVTHGHEEHFLDTPDIVKRTGATVVAGPAVCNFLRKRSHVPAKQLVPVEMMQSVEARGYRIGAFPWQHRDINLFKALTRAVFQGNATQLKWAWSSATNAPFYAPYTGYHVQLRDGTRILNYNEGFNTKMADAEIGDLARRFPADVLLAGMQLDFVADVARGARAISPRLVVLYPPHEKFHEMMGVSSRPWEEFGRAVQAAVPSAMVVIARPGDVFDAATGELLAALPTLQAA